MIYESGRMKVIENILDEVKKHKNDNGEVECYPSYDQEALKLVDDGHVDWLYERVQELETFKKSTEYTMDSISLEMIIEILLSELNDEKIYELEKQNKRYREAKDKLDAIFHERHKPYPSEYEDGYLDGLDRAIGIISKSLEGKE